MSSNTKILNNATDVYVTSRRPNLRQPNTARLRISAGGDGNVQMAYLFFSLPFPMGANVHEGLFRLTSSNNFTGSVTLTVQRITAKWNAGKLKYSNRPTTTGVNAVSVTKTNPSIGTTWEFDISNLLDDVSSGGQWWGLRVTSSQDPPVVVYSAQGASTSRPELEVTWGDEPDPPEDLYPAGARAVGVTKPILGFTFTDESGTTELNAVQIHYKASNTGFDPVTGFSSPTWNSGTIFTSQPSIDTSTISGAPTLTGAATWWTARVQDAAGVWSSWADPVSMHYTALLGATLDNPPAGGVVNDATPPVLWTITSGVQTAYKVTVYESDDPTTILWNSGKVSTAETDTAVPPKVILYDGVNYTLDLYLWDDQDREKNGTNPIYKRITKVFQFQAGSGVTAPTAVVATQVTPWPWVDITFSRSSAADEYNLWRDGVLIDANVPSSDVSIGGTNYKYRDMLASPRESHTWTVQAVVNKVTSAKVNSNSLSTRLIAPFMMELDSSNPVFFMNPALDPELMSIQEVQQPVNADPVLLTQFQGGYQGHLAGVFADNIIAGVSARSMRNIFKKWKRHPGDSYILYMVDEVIVMVPYNMTYVPRARSGQVLYNVEFDFFEVSP